MSRRPHQHRCADCNILVACPGEYERNYSGPDNRRLPQRFVWREKTGKVTKERMG